LDLEELHVVDRTLDLVHKAAVALRAEPEATRT